MGVKLVEICMNNSESKKRLLVLKISNSEDCNFPESLLAFETNG
jgi:hypothetical protein